jgi:hypothetical protein
MVTTEHEDDARLPGEELVSQGLRDLSAGRETEAALLLEIAAPRLRSIGIDVTAPQDPDGISAEHRLYRLLSATARCAQPVQRAARADRQLRTRRRACGHPLTVSASRR